MARAYNRLRETTFDLYVERDSLPAYYRFITLIAAWLVISGYTLFAMAASFPTSELRASHTVLATVAGVLLIFGYLAVAAIAFLSSSLLFNIDSTLYPTLISSFTGFLVTILTFSLHDSQLSTRINFVVPLVVSCLTTISCCILLWLMYREIDKIKSRDERRRWHIQMLPYTDPRAFQAHQRSASGPEDEAQRRQLARLLDDRREHPSMENMRGTYQIDLPGERFDRGRSSSVPAARRSFHVSNLLPWNKSSTGTFKDARERRREEIERSGLPPSANPLSATSPNGAWYTRSRSHSREPLPEREASAWGWPPATRYA